MLSVWQLKRQIAFLAALAVWADAPGNVVYSGGAVVSEDLEGNFASGSFLLDGPLPATLSFARVSCRGEDFDKSMPERIDLARFVLWSTAGGGWPFPLGVTGVAPPAVDSHGINMENGSLRNAVQGQGKSDGRSADELISRFLAQLTNPGQFTDSIHGFQGAARRCTAMAPVNGVQVLKRALEIDVNNASISDYYHAPLRLVGSAPVAGNITLTWALPPVRFDTFKIELWRGLNSGDPAPATRAGHPVALGSVRAVSVVDAPGSGTWNYSVFDTYTETPAAVTAAVADRASAACSSNTIVVP